MNNIIKHNKKIKKKKKKLLIYWQFNANTELFMNEFCFGKKSVPPLLYCNAQKKFDGNCECFFLPQQTVPVNLQIQNILLMERETSLYLTT